MRNKTNIVTIGHLAVSVVLIVVGVLMGEPDVVLNKAINICMECIGIG